MSKILECFKCKTGVETVETDEYVAVRCFDCGEEVKEPICGNRNKAIRSVVNLWNEMQEQSSLIAEFRGLRRDKDRKH